MKENTTKDLMLVGEPKLCGLNLDTDANPHSQTAATNNSQSPLGQGGVMVGRFELYYGTITD